MSLITTGSPSIDKVLGGGIRTGLITNILSDSRELDLVYVIRCASMRPD